MGSTPGAISSLSGIFSGGSGGGSGPSNTLASDPGIFSGSNQYASYPTAPVAGTVPGAAPLSGSTPTTGPSGFSYITGAPGSANEVPNTNSQHLVPTYDPQYTQQYYNTLMQQLGSGLPGFDLSTILPSSGQTTGAGQLNAPLNNVYQQLQSLLTGGPSSIPGAASATSMAATGNPVNQTPAWQAMIASEQQNTAQNANNLREQFASSGDLSSSPFGTAMQQFYNQNTENQNAQLTAATTAEGDTAAARELSAQQGLQGLASTTGSNLQTIDQNAINQMLQEFNYTLPQNNPMNQMFANAATATPGVVGAPKETALTQMSQIESLINGLF